MSSTEPTTQFDPNESEGSNGNPPSKKDVYKFTTLSAEQRRDLVYLTNPANAGLGSAFFDIDTLELTALGANIEVRGTWDAGSISDLGLWHELAQGGRVVNAIITTRGYLFPLGHKAIYVQHFRRVMAKDPSNSANASPENNFAVGYLQMFELIKVVEPIKSYGPSTLGEPFALADGGTTNWPFTQVRMITLESPEIDYPTQPFLPTTGEYANYYKQAFRPTVNSQNVQWDFVATDTVGRDVHFSMPLIFVYGYDPVGGPTSVAPHSEFDVGNSGSMSFTDRLVQHYYQKGASTEMTSVRMSDIGGVPIRYAPEVDTMPGGTTHPTLSILLGAATSNYDPYASTQATSPGKQALQAAGQPNFYPTIGRARVRIHAAEQLVGQNFDIPISNDPLPGDGVEIEYYGDYISTGASSTYGVPIAPPTGPLSFASPTGTPPNNGAVYAKIVESVPVTFPANTVGGLGTPNTSLSGLSAVAGLVAGDVDAFANNAPFSQLSSYFPASGVTSQLLGGLQLSDILDPNMTMPTITSQVDPVTGVKTVTYTMSTALVTWPTSPTTKDPEGLPIFVPDTDATPTPMLNLSATITPSTGTTPEQYSVTGTMDPFYIYLINQGGTLGVLELHFSSATFTAGSGQATNVSVDLDTCQFVGCLSFVQTLEQFLQALGLPGMTISVEPTDVKLSLSFSIPDQQTGVFNLSGMSLTAGVVVPFIDGPATASFAFASQADPFTVTYSCVGGGGCFAIAVGFGGMQSLLAQFEVEVQAAIGVVVASGNVSLSLGVYFKYQEGVGASLTGFVQLSGSVELLGIVTVSITLNVSLTWEITQGAIQGTATLRVGISICGFGVSIPITVTKSFGGATSSSSSNVGSPQVSDGSDDAYVVPGVGGAGARAGRGDGIQLDAFDDDTTPLGSFVQPIKPIERFTLPPAPAPITQPILFSDLISQDDWKTYCGAFGA